MSGSLNVPATTIHKTRTVHYGAIPYNPLFLLEKQRFFG